MMGWSASPRQRSSSSVVAGLCHWMRATNRPLSNRSSAAFTCYCSQAAFLQLCRADCGCGFVRGLLTLPCVATGRFCAGFRERLLADPSFLVKVSIEVGIGICTKLSAEYAKRQEAFASELDFVFANVLMALVADFMLVWLPAPTLSLTAASKVRTIPWVILHGSLACHWLSTTSTVVSVGAAYVTVCVVLRVYK